MVAAVYITFFCAINTPINLAANFEFTSLFVTSFTKSIAKKL